MRSRNIALQAQTKRITALFVSVVLTVLLAITFLISDGPSYASAYSIPNNAQASGTSGSCTWYITSASDASNPGQLVIYPTSGTSGTLKDFHYATDVDWTGSAALVQSVYVAPGVKANTNLTGAFKGCVNATEIDVANLDTSGVTAMGSMFNSCESLTSIPGLSNLDTSDVTVFSNMFRFCYGLTSLDLRSWSFASAEYTAYMFDYCTSITTIQLPTTVAPNLTSPYSMFDNCEKLQSINVSMLASGKVTSMASTFSMCRELTTITGLSGIVTSNTTSLSSAFYMCDALSSIDISDWDTSNVTNMRTLFTYDESLTSLTFGSGWNTAKVTNMQQFLEGCSGLSSIDLSMFSTQSATNMTDFFKNMTALRTVTLGSSFSFAGNGSATCVLPTPSGADAGGRLSGQWIADSNSAVYTAASIPSLTSDTYRAGYIPEPILKAGSTWDTSSVPSAQYTSIRLVDSYTPTGTESESWDSSAAGDGSVMSYLAADGVSVTIAGNGSGYIKANANAGYIFQNCSNVTSITGLDLLDTSDATTMESMFYGCTSLTSLDVDGFDTSNVTSMAGMFSNCNALTSLGPNALRDWDTSKVTAMNSMFSNCNSLLAVDVSEWDTSSNTSLLWTFQYCESLTTLDMGNWDVSNVRTMWNTFNGCLSLTTLDVSGWDTSGCYDFTSMFGSCNNVTTIDTSTFTALPGKESEIGSMFRGCESVTNIDLSSFNPNGATSMYYMFFECSALQTLDLSSLDTSQVTRANNIFVSCYNLRQVTLGSQFTFNGVQSSRLFNLPTPSNDDIPCATGSWKAVGAGTVAAPTGAVYLPSTVPNNVAETYVADIGTLGTVSISGTTTVGSTITANMSGNYGTTPAYQWQRGNSATGSFSNISGATSSSYELSTDDLGKYIRISVSDSGGVVTTPITATVGPAGKGSWTTMTVNLSDTTPCVGETITASPANAPGAGTNSFTYQWYIGGSAKSGATSASYSPSSADRGKSLYCKVSCTNTYYTVNTANSSTYTIGQGTLVGSVSVSGTPRYDSTLTADVSGLSSGATASYKWYRANTAAGVYSVISGATARTYTLGASDMGKYLKCYVTDSSGGFAGTLMSSSVGPVAKASWGNLSVTVTGEKKVDQNLTATPSNAPAQGTNAFSYQWMRADTEGGSYTNITGATAGTYTLTEDDYGKFVKCSISATNPYYTIGSGVSAGYGPIARNAPGDAQEEGTCGGVSWFIRSASDPDAPGELYIYPTNGVFGIMDDLSGESDGAPWHYCASLPQSIYVESGVQTNAVASHLFRDLANAVTADVDNLRFDVNTWYLVSLFEGCASLTSVDMTGWNTGNVRSVSHMFASCASLASVDLTPLDTAKCNYFTAMFLKCKALTTIDVTPLDTGMADSLSSMFSQCSNLVSVTGLETWDINTNLSDLSGLFSLCTKLKSVNVTGWNPSSVGTFDSVFSYCSSLETVTGLETWDTSSARFMTSMFKSCTNLTSVDVSNLDLGNVTYASYMFSYCNKLATIDVSQWDTGSLVGADCMFDECAVVQALAVDNWDVANVTNATNMFNGCAALTSLDLSGWDVRNLRQAQAMFMNCANLVTLDLSGWQTSSLTTLRSFLFGCSRLTSIPGVESFDTDLVTSMYAVFYSCQSLTSLNLSSWDTANVTDFGGAFAYCYSLHTLTGLSDWDTSKVTTFFMSFKGNRMLSTLDLTSWDTTASANMSNLFDGMSRLVQIKLGSSFNFAGNGAAIAAVLPTPAGTAPNGNAYTGNWVASSNGAVYAAANVPSLVANTYDAQVATLGSIVFSENPRIGYPVTASLSGSVSVTPEYQWSIGTSPTGSFANLVAGDTYTPVFGDFGKYLRMTVSDSSGNVVSSIFRVTDPVGAGTLSGTVAASGQTTFGETLTTSVSGLSDGATPRYQWLRSDSSTGTFAAIGGATASTHEMVAADVGKYLKCLVYDGTGRYTGTLMSNTLGPVAKAIPDKPVATIEDVTDDTITVTPVTGQDGVQYSSDGGNTWQDSNVFTDLLPDTEYDVVVRIPETGTHEEILSDPLPTSTDPAQISVTVPTQMTVAVAGDGTLTFPTNQYIHNTSKWNIALTAISSSKQDPSFASSNWSLHQGTSAQGAQVATMTFGGNGTITSTCIIPANTQQGIYWSTGSIADIDGIMGGTALSQYGSIAYTVAYSPSAAD